SNHWDSHRKSGKMRRIFSDCPGFARLLPAATQPDQAAESAGEQSPSGGFRDPGSRFLRLRDSQRSRPGEEKTEGVAAGVSPRAHLKQHEAERMLPFRKRGACPEHTLCVKTAGMSRLPSSRTLAVSSAHTYSDSIPAPD